MSQNIARINDGELRLPNGAKASSLASKPRPKTFLSTPNLAQIGYICHNLPEDEKDQFLAISGEDEFNADEAAVITYSAPGPKWVLLKEDGEPLGVAGFSMLRPEVWQSMMLVPDASWELYGRHITRLCLKVLKEMRNQGHRIQTLVLSERAKARAWYDRIGLQNEGTLRNYGANGEDFEMYSIVQDLESD